MTPEEKAVIQAAIDAHQVGREPSVAQQNILRMAVHQLIFACAECNQGGHTCPGDGDHIAHGESNCGQHDDPHQDACQEKYPCHDPDSECTKGCFTAGASELTWLPATFADCMAGDRIRLGGQETVVTWSGGVQQWHASNREWTDDAGKVRDHQKPWEHQELMLDLEANPGRHTYPPAGAIEILCDAERAAALELQRAFPGTTPVDN